MSGLGSWRSVGASGAVAAALGLAVMLTRPSAPPADALWPGGNPVVAARVAIERAGEPTLVIDRTAGGWYVTQPAPGPTLPGAVPDLLRAIAGARIQRRAERSPAEVAFSVRIDDAPPWQVSVPVPGGGRWWTRAGVAYLVDGWVAEAADLRVDRVRRTDPLPIDLEQAASIEVRGPAQTLMLIDGARTQLRETGPIAIGLAERRALVEALDGLVASSFPVAPSAVLAPRPWITVRAAGAELQLADAGVCADGSRRLATAIGDICAAASPALDAALATLAGPPADWMMTSLAWLPQDITLLGGARLSGHGGAWRVVAPMAPSVPADDVAARLVAGAIVNLRGPAVPTPAAPADGWVEVVGEGDRRWRIAVWRALGIAGRDGEPLALRLEPDELATLAATWSQLRERELWVEEPTSITVDELPASRPLALSAAQLASIAAPRAVARGLPRPSGAPARRLRINLAAPPVVGGQATQLELAVWRVSGACLVEAPDRDRPGSTDVARLEPATCAALQAPTR